MKLNSTKCLLEVFLTWKISQLEPKPQGQEEGQGALNASPDITYPQPVCSVLQSVQTVLPALGRSSRAIKWHWVHSHCNRQPPSQCSELMVIKRDSAFGMGDHISLNKLPLFHLVIPKWTRKLEFWGGWPKTELPEHYHCCLLMKMHCVKKRQQDPSHLMHSLSTQFCPFYLEEKYRHSG